MSTSEQSPSRRCYKAIIKAPLPMSMDDERPAFKGHHYSCVGAVVYVQKRTDLKVPAVYVFSGSHYHSPFSITTEQARRTLQLKESIPVDSKLHKDIESQRDWSLSS